MERNERRRLNVARRRTAAGVLAALLLGGLWVVGAPRGGAETADGEAKGTGEGASAPCFTSRDFRGPEFCRTCHPRHYMEWRGSAHAYATTDPIFQACNRKAHEDTGGEIGGLCIGCHAPLVARTGELPANFSAADLAAAAPVLSRGVSCEVCHRMTPPAEGKAIGNASFGLNDGVGFYGRLRRPKANAVHASIHSEFLGESRFCGSCHDVLHDHGDALEKTFVEWSLSPQREPRALECQNCHMLPYSGRAAKDGPFREVLHRHNFPGVTVPLEPFPNRGLQTEEVQQFLRTAARMSVVAPAAVAAGEDLQITVLTKNSGSGHNLPSGISTFRQMWLEVTARDASGRVFFRSGHTDANGDLLDERSELAPGSDTQLVSFSDRFLDTQGTPVLFLWEASRLESRSLRPLEERSSVYRIAVPENLLHSRIEVDVRLLFRFFSPYGLRAFRLPALVEELPVWEMDRFRTRPIDVESTVARRTVYHVPGDFERPQEALDALQDGDRVLVAPGDYVLRQALDFRGKGIHLKSVGGPNRTTLRLAEGVTSGMASVVVFRSGEGADAHLEGFTITGGKGAEVAGLRRGGGIFIARSSPTVSGNIIVGNRAAGGVGGAICCEEGESRIYDNDIRDNWATYGGGVAYKRTSSASENNDGMVWGFSANRLEGNVARRGAALFLEGNARVRVEACTLAGNLAFEEGGAVFASDGIQIDIDRSTVYRNQAYGDFGALRVAPGTQPRIANTIFSENQPFAVNAAFRYCLLDREGNVGDGNVVGFPVFLDPTGVWQAGAAPDGFAEAFPRKIPGTKRWRWPGRWIGGGYHLLVGSSAIDTGDPLAPAEADDSRLDIGAWPLERPLRAFVRGDVDGDGTVAWEDLDALVRHLVLGAGVPCEDAADVDDSGTTRPLDACRLGLFLIFGVARPVGPFPECGLDPTFGEGLGCQQKGEDCVGSENPPEPLDLDSGRQR